jgi:hypothetical protein
MSASTEFQPNQILYLQHQTARLYAELIQVVPERQLGWVRPLALVEFSDRLDWQPTDFTFQVNDFQPGDRQTDDSARRSQLHDLRQGSDLLCPISLFQMALDVEVVPVLMALETFKQHPDAIADLSSGVSRTAHLRLQEFVRCLWQTHPQVF